jgi:hypothetical protein
MNAETDKLHERLCERCALLYRVFKQVGTLGGRFFDVTKIVAARMAYYRCFLAANRMVRA